MFDWQSFLAACSAIGVIAGAIAAIKKWISPALKLTKDVADLKKASKANQERIETNEETNRLMCRALLCLLDVAELQEKDYPETLKGIKGIKNDIQSYLLDRMVQK